MGIDNHVIASHGGIPSHYHHSRIQHNLLDRGVNHERCSANQTSYSVLQRAYCHYSGYSSHLIREAEKGELESGCRIPLKEN